MFWKASKRERHESDDEHFGVGPYRALRGRSHRLAKLSRSGGEGGQNGLCRAARRPPPPPPTWAGDHPAPPEPAAPPARPRRPPPGCRPRPSPPAPPP